MQLKNAKLIITIDDEISQLFRGFSSWNYEELKQSIAENGILVPVELADDGTVIDGHNRIKAWIEGGRDISELPVNIRHYRNREEMTGTAISLNIQRRHLNAAQRVWIAYKYFLPEERRRRGSDRLLVKADLIPSFEKKFTRLREGHLIWRLKGWG